MSVIKGNTVPKAEVNTEYIFADNQFAATSQSIFNKDTAKYTWTLFKKNGNVFKQVVNNIKYGKKSFL